MKFKRDWSLYIGIVLSVAIMGGAAGGLIYEEMQPDPPKKMYDIRCGQTNYRAEWFRRAIFSEVLELRTEDGRFISTGENCVVSRRGFSKG